MNMRSQWSSSQLSVLVVMSTMTLAVVDVSEKCADNEVLDLDDQCVPRFKAPRREACPTPSPIEFGGHDIRLDGRMALFWCDLGWELVPETNDHAMCRLGEWDRHSPLCVRPGCLSVESDDPHLLVQMRHEGALALFSCTGDNHQIKGSKVLACNGHRWNDSIPLCQPIDKQYYKENKEDYSTTSNGVKSLSHVLTFVPHFLIWTSFSLFSLAH